MAGTSYRENIYSVLESFVFPYKFTTGNKKRFMRKAPYIRRKASMAITNSKNKQYIKLLKYWQRTWSGK